MNANEKTLNTFATRVRQMILQYEEIKKENNELYDLVDQREKEIASETYIKTYPRCKQVHHSH